MSSAVPMIIGGGLAGCEAAWQLLRRGHSVRLYEMKPRKFSSAHCSPLLAELVCSNSFRSRLTDSPVGLLKEEMRMLNSLVMEAAVATEVPAGKALAVDRTKFSRYIEEKLLSCKGMEIIREEVTDVPKDSVVVIASGPLTSDDLALSLSSMTGGNHLYFYDAISPIVEGNSVDPAKVFRASRYAEGDGDYLNCPLEKDDYERFWEALVNAEEVPLAACEEARYFEGCLPIEVMAKRGRKTLAFGPMKPVGISDPKTGSRPYAVVQLRREDRAEAFLSLVGFQTKLTWPEQRRVFRMIPGLQKAEFARYGSVHRNTFINSPVLLGENLQLKTAETIFFAGQITGVEGYVESAATGILAGINVSNRLAGRSLAPPPPETAVGSLLQYITKSPVLPFQPSNVNFSLFPPLSERIPRTARRARYASRSLSAMARWLEEWAP